MKLLRVRNVIKRKISHLFAVEKPKQIKQNFSAVSVQYHHHSHHHDCSHLRLTTNSFIDGYEILVFFIVLSLSPLGNRRR